MVRFSPGIAQGCSELLTLAKKYPQQPQSLVHAFDAIGTIPTSNLLATAQALDWVWVNDKGILIPTVSGEKLLSFDDYGSLLRQMLLDYIDIERPSWIQNAASGRARVLAFAGPEIGQVFVEANLANGIEEHTVAFWDMLAARARGQKDAKLNDLGRQGERLSLMYEEQRTKQKAKWISIESNADGYDILSVMDKDDPAKLSIEVKTSAIGIHGSLYLTSNEWERAQETSNHIFHLWDVCKSQARLGVVTVSQMQEHVPANLGQGEWQSVRVPFRIFENLFQPFRV